MHDAVVEGDDGSTNKIWWTLMAREIDMSEIAEESKILDMTIEKSPSPLQNGTILHIKYSSLCDTQI